MVSLARLITKFCPASNVFCTICIFQLRRMRGFVSHAREDRISNLPHELIELILQELPFQDAARTIILSKTWRYIWTMLFTRMVNVYKRRFVSCSSDDKFSNLPDQLIELILDKLPVKDAARTSVLSKTWTYRWTSMNALVFSRQFSQFKMLLQQQERIPKWHPHMFKRLRRLDLVDINFGDIDQVQGVLCMLRNTPNLEQLCVRSEQMGCEDMHFNVEPAVSCLQALDCLGCSLHHLQRITFILPALSKPEMLFIKMLLNNSPTLERLIIHARTTDDLEKRLDVRDDLVTFHRASTFARISYLMKNPPPQVLLHCDGRYEDDIDDDDEEEEEEDDDDNKEDDYEDYR
ncbi:hypothetical protein QVD17_11731 [Tagetes erecta]|uniref:F-box domain-containing protein n=1 Tax=Tagetes erecta TaxID=13708 RepID=A0AAD8L1A9_TARER|nr:hypothetical protein QVD17_11731 [Tagetes erecta]